jgi:hypothetical protein
MVPSIPHISSALNVLMNAIVIVTTKHCVYESLICLPYMFCLLINGMGVKEIPALII